MSNAKIGNRKLVVPSVREGNETHPQRKNFVLPDYRREQAIMHGVVVCSMPISISKPYFLVCLRFSVESQNKTEFLFSTSQVDSGPGQERIPSYTAFGACMANS